MAEIKKFGIYELINTSYMIGLS